MSNVKSELIDSLMIVETIFRQFIGTVPKRLLRVHRSKEFWSIEQHIKHIALVQPMLFNRMMLVKNEKKPSVKPYIPGDEEKEKHKTITVKEALDDFGYWRVKQCKIIDSYTRAEWKKEIKHPEYVKYNTEIMVRHTLMHDYWHMYRIEELWLSLNIE